MLSKGTNMFFYDPGYKLSSTGVSKNHIAFALGRFDFLPGVEEERHPTYKQAQSKEIPSEDAYLLYR